MMKKIILIFLIPIFLFSCVIKLNKHAIETPKTTDIEQEIENEYVYGTDDIPLFKGLVQLKDETTDFDTVSGNIVISVYEGAAKLNEVKSFYIKTLPQLGFELTSNKPNQISYKRNKDNLEISFVKHKNRLNVKFSLSSFL